MNGIDTDVVVAIAHELAAQVGQLRYNLWFKDNARLELTDQELVIGVPNLFFQEWLSSNFMAPLRKATEIVLGSRLPIRMVVDGELFRVSRGSELKEPGESQGSGGESSGVSAAGASPAPAPGRLPGARGQTLANFVVGPSNRMAHAAALSIVEQSAMQFNPLIFYGPLGLGKTHLLRAICHELRQRHRDLAVVYLTAEAFTNAFLEDMRTNRLGAFRQRIRGADLLLIDDLQFLAAKKATQNELLYTYEAFDAAGKQLVLASEDHPRFISDFNDQLLNRLVSGISCPMEPPDFDTRVAILTRRCHDLGMPIDREIVEFVASHFRTNVRELEGALNCLKAHAAFSRCTLNLAAAQHALTDLMRHSTKTVTVKEVEEAVCHVFSVTAADLRSASRLRALTQPRMLAMYLARKHTGSSYVSIGGYFGGRDHSTVMSAERKVQSWIDESSTVFFAGRPWGINEAIRAVEQRLN